MIIFELLILTNIRYCYEHFTYFVTNAELNKCL